MRPLHIDIRKLNLLQDDAESTQHRPERQCP